MKLTSGKYAIHVLDCGTFRLDGGAMFGVVPRTIWGKSNPPDDLNRITLGLHPILIEGGGRLILADAGIGDKFAPKYLEIYGVSNDGHGIVEELSRAGFKPEQVTDVFVTHLHFDHCGGFTRFGQDGKSELVFKNADIYVQRRHRDAALSPTERDRASFMKDNIAPILESPRLKLLDGCVENLFPGIHVRCFDGHTFAMQGLVISDGGSPVYYLSDVVPTMSHVPVPFIMGYDLFPLTIVEEKKKTFAEAAGSGGLVVFEHEPGFCVGKISSGEKGFSATKLSEDIFFL